MTATKTEPTGRERQMLAAQRGETRALRPYSTGIEIRAADTADDPYVTFVGHASVTAAPYEVAGGPEKGGWMETIVPGAFARTLSQNPDVSFLVNHEGLPLARTKPAQTLTLAEDPVGLAVEARLNTDVTLVHDLVLLMRDGNLNQMSFAFRVVRQEWRNADGEPVPWWDLDGIDRQIQEVNLNRGDVSVVTNGQNPYTDASLRRLDELCRELTAGRDSLDPDELRAAIEYFQSLLPPKDGVEEGFLAAAADADYRRRLMIAAAADL